MGRSNSRRNVRPSFTAVSLFAGAGGLTEGFCKVGFRLLVAVEENEVAAQTLKLNHRKTHIHSGRVEELNAGSSKWDAILKGTKVDVVIGGPPCQGFSIKVTVKWSKADVQVFWSYRVHVIPCKNAWYEVA